MKQIQQVSDSELELMKIIWANNGTALYAGITEELEKKGKDWKKNTILVLLSRLVEKGLLSTNKIGRRNEYVALVKEDEYLTAQTKTFLDKMYEGSAKGLISTLLQQDFLSSDDVEKLKNFWDGEKKK